MSDGANQSAGSTPAVASRMWRRYFRIQYRIIRLMDPLVRTWLAMGLPGLDGVVRMTTVGRRSGRDRSLHITLLHVDGGWYLGHPNGHTGWTRNAETAGSIRIDPAPGVAGGREFPVVLLPNGPERSAVIAATRTQQPFPGNVIYRAAARHIEAVGVYFRVERGA